MHLLSNQICDQWTVVYESHLSIRTSHMFPLSFITCLELFGCACFLILSCIIWLVYSETFNFQLWLESYWLKELFKPEYRFPRPITWNNHHQLDLETVVLALPTTRGVITWFQSLCTEMKANSKSTYNLSKSWNRGCFSIHFSPITMVGHGWFIFQTRSKFEANQKLGPCPSWCDVVWFLSAKALLENYAPTLSFAYTQPHRKD